MSRDVEELFGEGGGAPVPRTTLVLSLLTSGLLLAFLGLACSTAPGGVLVLLAWVVVEKEMDRVESGYLPADTREHVGRLRLFTWAGVLVVIGLFVAQALLLCSNSYDALWLAFLTTLGGAA